MMRLNRLTNNEKIASHKFLLLLLAFLALVIYESDSWGRELNIWAIGESYRIDPTSGVVLGNFWANSLPPKIKNPVWDGARKRISLRSTKNGAVAFQVILERTNKPVHKVHIVFSNLTGPQTEKLPVIKLFLEGYLNIKTDGLPFSRWIPDLLIPFEVEGIHPFSIPLKRVHLPFIPGQKNQAVWVDLYIPVKTTAGKYTSELIVEIDGEEVERIALQIEVLDLILPSHIPFGIDLNDYGPKYLRDWNGMDHRNGLLQIEKKFYRLAHQHGVSLNILPYRSQIGTPWPGLAPELEGEGKTMRITNWDIYDKRMGPYFDGTAFEDGIPLIHHYLPFNPEWPSDFSLYDTDRDRYEAEWKTIAQEFVRHAIEKGWTQTTFQIYLNQKPQKNNRIPWRLDEPRGVKDYKALRYFADLSHRSFRGMGSENYKFRIDISHFYCEKHRGNQEKDFRVNGGKLILDPVDIWVISYHSLPSKAASPRARNLQKKGRKVWQYGNAPRLSESLLSVQQRVWKGWLEGWDGILFWKSIARKIGEGDGKKFLIYSGAPLGYEGVFPSMRLKALRRGLNDYKYMKLIAASKPGGKSWVNKWIETTLPQSDPKARARLQNEALRLFLLEKTQAGLGHVRN